MELQWPLILFTTFIAWSAGVFGAQGLLAVRGTAFKAQVPALVASLVLMVIGGVAVFMHLEHWERIFNGFGHITSGITQELIGIIAMLIVMVVFFAQVRQRGDGTAPAWCGVLALVVAVALVVAMGHSYMMESRPAWNSIIQLLTLLGAACVLGPATLGVVMAFCGDDPAPLAVPTIAGAALNAVLSCVYLFVMGGAQGSYTQIGYYYDPTQIGRGMIDFDAATGLFAGGRGGLVAVAIVCVLLAVVLALLLRSRGKAGTDAAGASADASADGTAALAGRWKSIGIAVVAAAVVAAIVLRVVFYQLGNTVYIFF